MAIAQHPRLEIRLEVLLWHLAERLARVHTDGVHLTLPVTHETLGNLVAARRPPPAARRPPSLGVRRVGRPGRARRRAP